MNGVVLKEGLMDEVEFRFPKSIGYVPKNYFCNYSYILD
jgi:hypothetical protein